MSLGPRTPDSNVVQAFPTKHPEVTRVSDDGGGGRMDRLEQRVTILEKGFEKLDGKIDKLTDLVNSFGLKTSERLSGIEGRLTGIEKTLDAKAGKADLTPIEAKLGDVGGTVRGLPGLPAMITLVLSTITLCLGGAATLAWAFAKFLKP